MTPNTIIKRLTCIFAIAAAIGISGCDGSKARKAWDEQTQAFIASYLALHPEHASQQGHREFLGKVTDYSQQGFDERLTFFKNAKVFFESTDITMLDSERKFEHQYIQHIIEAKLWQLESNNPWKYSTLAYEQSLDPSNFIEHNGGSIDARFDAYTNFLSTLPRTLEQMRNNIEGPLGASYLELAIQQFSGLRQYISSKPRRVFGHQIAVTDEYSQHLKQAILAIDGVIEWLEAMPNDIADYRLGKSQLEAMLLATEGITVDLDELTSVAQASIDANLAKLELVCDLYAKGLSISRCIERAQASKPYPNAIASLRREIPKLYNFVRDNDIVTIPPMQSLEVRQTPSHLRRYSVFLASPSFADDSHAVVYASLPDPNLPEKQRHALTQSRSKIILEAAHEAWPGHYLHEGIAETSRSTIAKMFPSYALKEGWAYYAEELIIEYGYAKNDPELAVTQLALALRRDTRMIASIELHANNRSLSEVTTLFEERAFLSTESAKLEAMRGIFEPEYLNYTLGKLYILKLRNEWSNPIGGKRAWPDFHQALLQFGSPPLGLVEQLLFRWDSAPR